MGAKRVVQISCDHPDCEKTVGVEGNASDLHRLLPKGWWTSGSWKPTVACEAHAPEAQGFSEACREWHKREVAARNQWLKENPSPKVPDWLRDLHLRFD